MITPSYDFIIIGGGMVGLSLANQLLERNISKKILILDKEMELGLHSSGRNSGVIHSGLYYKPNSLKAKVCVSGAKRLREWVKERNLSINECGKVIVPQKEYLDSQLDLLVDRGVKNGSVVEILNEKQLKELIPKARTTTGRAIWSPNTAVVKPIQVISHLQKELKDRGIEIIKGIMDIKFNKNNKNILELSNGKKFYFNHLFNCAGLQADRIARKFDVGADYIILPFKGIYWQLKKNCPIKIKTNLYPVPDLNVPFLGVHFTPGPSESSPVSIGPTATPAFGRENYNGFEKFEAKMTFNSLSILARQYIDNKKGFRRYVHEQAFLNLPPLFLKGAQELIPSIKFSDMELSKKLGIRSQLFNLKKRELVDDFLCVEGDSSTHILNAISPAFTASFELADLIINSKFESK